jgi:hypothetical protein
MPNSPEGRRNRIGCFIILALLVVFAVLYLIVGFSAEPGNNVTERIQPIPAQPR